MTTMRLPILTYQPMVIHGNDYATNHLKALAADLEVVTEAGFRIVPLAEAIRAWLEGRGEELRDAVAFCVEDGTDFDFVDLPHPTAGTQRSVLNTLRDFAARHPGAQPALHATSFVVVSPEARTALDRACMIGQGWWSDRWWADAVASGFMHIANHSWDHHHEALPESFSLGARRGTFHTIDNMERADHEIRQAARHLRERVDNPGVALFAYPYGQGNDYLSRDYFPRYGEELRIRAAFTDRAGFLEPGTVRWDVPRFMFGRDWSSPDRLRELLAESRKRPVLPTQGMAPPTGATTVASTRPWGSARKLEARLEGPSRWRTHHGMAGMKLLVSGGEPGRSPHYQLHAEVEGTPLRHVSSIDLSRGDVELPLQVNTHLLANGSAKVRLSLVQGDRRAWSHTCKFDLHNDGPLADTVRKSLEAYGTPWLLEGPADSASFDMGGESLKPWFDRADALQVLEGRRRAGQVTDEEAGALRQFVESGFAMLPQPIEDALLKRLDGELDDAVARKIEGYEHGTSQRIRNLHLRYGGVEALWRHPMVLRYLELIFGVPARPCQTLTYVFGSQQGAHQDTIHLTPFPQGYMCGVWVALEDVKPSSGELEVYPGTHKLPRVYMNGSGCPKVLDDDWSTFDRTVSQRWRGMIEGREKITYRPKRGSVLIWHENLMHAGGVRKDLTLSRRSIVSHYFADGAIAFYDSTGMPGSMD